MKFKFATAINCIDGRIQAPVAEFIRSNYFVDYVDMITLPGSDKVLSKAKDGCEIESIKKKVLFSFNNRDSKLVFVVSHHDCLGNPCGKRTHLRQLRNAIKNVRKWCPKGKVRGIWVNEERKAFLVK